MKVTNTVYPNLQLASQDIRTENFYIDFFFSTFFALIFSVSMYVSTGNWLFTILTHMLSRRFYYLLFESINGRTPGKYATQTKVVTIDKKEPSFLQLIIRNNVRFYSLISGVSDNETALHDAASKTFVIHDPTLKKIDFKSILFLIFLLGKLIFWWFSFVNYSNTIAIQIFYVVMLSLTALGMYYTLKKLFSKK